MLSYFQAKFCNLFKKESKICNLKKSNVNKTYECAQLIAVTSNYFQKGYYFFDNYPYLRPMDMSIF